MEIVETAVFTRQITEFLPDAAYRELQEALILRPDDGDLIPGSKGLRKIRWGLSGKGKRGGIRVIYFWAVTRNQLWMLLAYTKAAQENLDIGQLAALRKITERWNHG